MRGRGRVVNREPFVPLGWLGSAWLGALVSHALEEDVEHDDDVVRAPAVVSIPLLCSVFFFSPHLVAFYARLFAGVHVAGAPPVRPTHLPVVPFLSPSCPRRFSSFARRGLCDLVLLTWSLPVLKKNSLSYQRAVYSVGLLKKKMPPSPP